MVIIENLQRGRVYSERTVRKAFDLVIEYHTRQKEKIFVKDFLNKNMYNRGLIRMYYRVQKYLRINNIDITDINKEQYIKEFVKKRLYSSDIKDLR